ncbi:TonB-dependent receptor domain-containing protein [Sphingorhabdus sp.]|uniref:TonB-dependent receptor domain-containing protein n=1 Tax=Sphingorhabdus sp. TaxID=1902408 RepID=UPI0039BCEA76
MGRYYRGYIVKNTRISNLKYAAAPLALGLALISTPSFAQDAAAEEETVEAIVVTGSLITNPNLERSAPVNVTSAEEMELLQSNLAEEVLREIPGVVASIGSAVNNGNGGASYVNLRGIGSNRNVVLLDGDRIVPAGFGGQVDLNNIPLALVERVDVLTGGASTTYGADAVGGVVNFILKNDFSGLEAQSSYQLTDKSDGDVYRADVTIGANFDDGRGNAVFGVGYQKSEAVYQGARDVSLDTLETYSGTALGSGTSNPSRFSGGRLVSGTGNGGTNQINDAGQLVPTFKTFNFNPYNVFQTPFERFNMFGQARYEVSDAIEVYSRGLFSKNTVNTIIAPSGAFGISVNIPLNNPFLPAAMRNQFCAFDVNPSATVYTPRFSQAACDAAANPSLRPGQPGYLEIGTGGASATATTSGNGLAVLQAWQPFDLNGNGVIEAGEGYNPNPQTLFARRATEAGPRISEYVTTVFDYRLGARGSITDSIDWDISGAYGQSENIQTIKGYTLNSRFRQSLRAGGTASAPVCFDTSNGCVAANVFGTIQPEAIPFLVQESTSFTKTSLAQVKGTINGDAGFTSPFAEDSVAFAVGGEYRKYTARQGADALAKGGDLGGAGGATPDISGGFDVYEGFGELVVPLVSDKPFVNSLTVEGGLRYSSYTVDTPGNPSYNTTTFKAGGTWEPTEGLAIRGNFARAVRAPNIGELFSPVNTGLTNLGTDPCATLTTAGAVLPGRPATGPTGELRAVCLAQGANVGNINSIPQPNAGQVNSTGGGNVNVKPEKSDSFTIGAIFQPARIPGFTASIDYYNIKVTGAISSPTPGDVIAACFGTSVFSPPAGASTSAACTSIRRSPADGGLSGDPSTFTGLPSVLSNAGAIETDGIDLIMNYKTDLTDKIALALSFNGNYTFKSTFNAFVLNPESVNRDCTGYFSSNCGSLQPDFSWSQRTTLSYGKIDVSLLWRHLSAMEQEPLDVIDGGAFFNGTIGASIPGVGGRTVNFGKIKAYDYFDLSARLNATENLTITASVQNLLDKDPPLTGNNAGSTSYNSGNTFPSTYDALGRRYAVTAKLRF